MSDPLITFSVIMNTDKSTHITVYWRPFVFFKQCGVVVIKRAHQFFPVLRCTGTAPCRNFAETSTLHKRKIEYLMLLHTQ